MITALIFDFDGLLVDTETPGLVSWQQIYAAFGQTLSLDLWQGALGTNHGFNALEHLATLHGQPLDRERVLRERQGLKHQLAAQQPLLPGVLNILTQAQALGLPCAVASSSNREWVEGWLNHHSIRHHFACVRTSDDVTLTKPAPDLFLSAAACLNVPPSACLVFEDSPNGILAAKAAAMRCVAVPGAITRQIALPPADLTLATLDELPLTELLTHFNTAP